MISETKSCIHKYVPFIFGLFQFKNYEEDIEKMCSSFFEIFRSLLVLLRIVCLILCSFDNNPICVAVVSYIWIWRNLKDKKNNILWLVVEKCLMKDIRYTKYIKKYYTLTCLVKDGGGWTRSIFCSFEGGVTIVGGIAPEPKVIAIDGASDRARAFVVLHVVSLNCPDVVVESWVLVGLSTLGISVGFIEGCGIPDPFWVCLICACLIKSNCVVSLSLSWTKLFWNRKITAHDKTTM